MQQQVLIRTRAMQDIEARDPEGRSIDQILRDLYVTRGMTVDEVGAELDITAGAVSRWLDRWGIPARPRGTPKAEVA